MINKFYLLITFVLDNSKKLLSNRYKSGLIYCKSNGKDRLIPTNIENCLNMILDNYADLGAEILDENNRYGLPNSSVIFKFSPIFLDANGDGMETKKSFIAIKPDDTIEVWNYDYREDWNCWFDESQDPPTIADFKITKFNIDGDTVNVVSRETCCHDFDYKVSSVCDILRNLHDSLDKKEECSINDPELSSCMVKIVNELKYVASNSKLNNEENLIKTYK